MTTMDPPVHLELPLSPPDPAAGCGVCAALVQQRNEAATRDDPSAVTDCNVEIRNHRDRHESWRRL